MSHSATVRTIQLGHFELGLIGMGHGIFGGVAALHCVDIAKGEIIGTDHTGLHVGTDVWTNVWPHIGYCGIVWMMTSYLD